jgi:hypothetical protein
LTISRPERARQHDKAFARCAQHLRGTGFPDHQREMIGDAVQITGLLSSSAQRDAWRPMLSRDCRRLFLSVAQIFDRRNVA